MYDMYYMFYITTTIIMINFHVTLKIKINEIIISQNSSYGIFTTFFMPQTAASRNIKTYFVFSTVRSLMLQLVTRIYYLV